jgi:HK97 family phage portal protein
VLDAAKSPVDDHPALAMLRSMPNGMSESALMRRIVQYMTHGGARLHKLRANDSRVLGLQPYTSTQVRPVRAKGRSVMTTTGWQQFDGSKVIDTWDVEDVVSLDWPIDDVDNPGNCLSPFDAIVAEVAQDNEMTSFLTNLLENDAVARTIILTPTPPSGRVTAGPEYRKETREAWSEQYSGAGRGLPAVMDFGQTVERLSLSLEEMAFDALRRVPESRICAAFRVPAQLAGITAGLDSGTYANFAEARSAFTESTLSPLWRYISDELTRGLQSDFDPKGTARWEYWHVTTDVAALQDDANATAERQRARSERVQQLQTAYKKGDVTREAAIANAVNELTVDAETAEAYFPVIEATEKANQIRESVGGNATLVDIIALYTAGGITRESAIWLAVNQYGYDATLAPGAFPESAFGVNRPPEAAPPEAAPPETTTPTPSGGDTTDTDTGGDE